MKRFLIELSAAVLLAGCASGSTAAVSSPTPAYENPVSLNTTEPDMSEYKWLNDSDPAFVEITASEAVRMFTEGGTGVLYFGRSDCPFCQRAVPVLNAAAKAMDVKIYYIDVDLTKLTMADYNAISPYISESFVKETKDAEASFMIPDVVAVHEGQYVDSKVSLADGYVITSADSQMSDEQKMELQETYEGLIRKAAAGA